MEERVLKSYKLVDDNNLLISEMSDKIISKFEMLDELLSNYEEADDANECKNIMAQIDACDNGLSADIESYMAEKGNTDSDDEEQSAKSQKEMADGGNVDSPTTHDKPSWRFWM